MIKKQFESENIKGVIAKNVRLARHIQGLTQSELAKKAGISRATLTQLELGDGNLTLDNLVAVANAFEISPVLLLLGKKELQAITEGINQNQNKFLSNSLSSDDIDQMNNLLESELYKNKIAVAKQGVEAVVVSKHVAAASAGVGIGAAIGSVLMPGVGTIIGATLGLISLYKNK